MKQLESNLSYFSPWIRDIILLCLVAIQFFTQVLIG